MTCMPLFTARLPSLVHVRWLFVMFRCFARDCTVAELFQLSDDDSCTSSALRGVVGPLIPCAVRSFQEATPSDPERLACCTATTILHRIRKPTQARTVKTLICVHWPSHPQLRRSHGEIEVFLCMLRLLSAYCWHTTLSLFLQASWSVACWRLLAETARASTAVRSWQLLGQLLREWEERLAPCIDAKIHQTRSNCEWENMHKHTQNRHVTHQNTHTLIM